MNAQFLKMHVSLNSPMFWRAEIVRVNENDSKIKGDYLHTIELHTDFNETMPFEKCDKILRDLGYIPVKDNFSSLNIDDIREVLHFSTEEFRAIFEQSLSL